MNVGIVTTWFERGAAIVSRAYVDVLKQRHKVFVYARGGERYARDDEKWNNPYVTWGKVVRYSDTAVDWRDFQRWVASNGIELLIFNEQQSWDIILRSLKLNIVLGAYVDYYTSETYRFFSLYDFLLCNTMRHYNLFKDHPGAMFIPWGTDLQVFRPRPRNRTGHETVFFHSCGVSAYRKGTDILVKAFRKVSGSARLAIHSQGRLNGEVQTLAEIAADPRIKLIEEEASGPGLYQLGDVYVYPSRLDGLGLTIAEALASGLPVITTDSPPMNEFVVDGFNGKLVDVAMFSRRSDDYYWPMSICNETKLADAMQFFVDNRSDIERFRLQAREDAEAKLDWRKNAESLPSIVERLSHRKQTDLELVKAVARYDRRRNRYPPWVEPLTPLLRRLGIARARRKLREFSS
ncbi:MAG: glycosyltransferase family 4 protein [Candidatus Bathyarchaeia archaeon]